MPATLYSLPDVWWNFAFSPIPSLYPWALPARVVTRPVQVKWMNESHTKHKYSKNLILLFWRFKSSLAWNMHCACYRVKTFFFLIFQWNAKLTVSWNSCLTRVTEKFSRPGWCLVVTKVLAIFVLTREDLPAARGKSKFWTFLSRNHLQFLLQKKDMLTSGYVDFPYTVITVDGLWAAL